MDYQQPHGHMRHPPPPPSAPDPYQRPPLPPPPSNHPWSYSASQFHYQPQTLHSPSPPPPQWPQPPHSSDHAQYPPPPPPPPPYQPHQPPHYHAHPHYPHHPPLPPRPLQPYSQDRGNGSWNHHQSWQHPTEVNNNEEDWAAKAKAWAAAKSASENQPSSSQFVPAGRPDEQNHFHEQYPQFVNPQYPDGHTPVPPASNYNQFPVAMGPSNRTGVGQFQDSQYMSSGKSSYGADGHAPFPARDGGIAGDSIPSFLPQEKSPISPLVRRQEVPSSYSSVPGNVEAGNGYEKLNSSSSTSGTSIPPHHFQHMPPTTGRFGWVEEPYHVLSSQQAESVTDISNQPLNFAPHFNHDTDSHIHPNYAHTSSLSARGGDPTVAISSNYAWPPPTAPGAVYPPAPPTMPLGSQADHPIAMASPVSGHTAPLFPPGPGFQPAIAMVGPAFGVGAGVTPHPATFSGDAFGSAERPKKASVPNWLREEIIKNKAVITSSTSALKLPRVDLPSMEEEEEENDDRFSRKGDQPDSKSIDSSGSTEDEDEDEVETARTAAINQEIKRVLTEVLLKVTDELFDEIATKVLKEDDLSVQVDQDSELSSHHILPSAPSVSIHKASAKILIPTKAKESDSEKYTSGSPGDILGLASYASDEEDELQSPGKPSSKESSVSRLLEGDSVIENGGSHDETEQRNITAKLESGSIGRKSSDSVATLESNVNMPTKELTSADAQHFPKSFSGIVEKNEYQRGYDISNLSNSLAEKAVERDEMPDEKIEVKRWMNSEILSRNTRNGSDKNNELESRKSSIKKEHKGSDSSKGKLDKPGDEEHRNHEERCARTDRNDYHDNSKDKAKEKGKTEEKAKNTESRKRISPSNDKEGVTEAHKDKRSSSKKDNDEKRKDRTEDDRKERSRHKSGVESSRHKRRRSSSVDARDRKSMDNTVVNRANDCSDQSSDDSKRKSHHSRRHKSPLPTRTRKRGKRSPSRSRSRSPVHRRR